MPDTSNAKDEHKDSNGGVVHVKASTRHTKSGDVVQVRSLDRHVDPMGETLKSQGTSVPLVAIPGKFPLGRSTPGTPAVTKAEQKRQDYELKMAQDEVKQLKEILASIPQSKEDDSPDQPTTAPSYQGQFGYGDGTGEVPDSGGFTSSGASQ